MYSTFASRPSSSNCLVQTSLIPIKTTLQFHPRISNIQYHKTSHIINQTMNLPLGTSDPVTYTCSCSCSAPNSSDKGTCLLFYRYYKNYPRIEPQPLETPEELANWHHSQADRYNLGGKIRVAQEGFNVTVAGTTTSIHNYIQDCRSHWSFANIPLSTKLEQDLFFKPSEGCACAFLGKCNIRQSSEITPMGVTNYEPQDWDIIESLSPEQFHRRCMDEENIQLIDVRNHYESRIGYFVNPNNGEPALRPEVRRFSQWPQYVKKHVLGGQREGMERKQYLTYCTGGIRCEKGARWMAEGIRNDEGGSPNIATLQGGIAAYLAWVDGEIKGGRMLADDSLFRGRNYVFDGRGSTGLKEGSMAPVSRCHSCGILSGDLGKCCSYGCHKVLVVCPNCDEGTLRCCEDCLEIDEKRLSRMNGEKVGSRPICACEREREARLWDVEVKKIPTNQNQQHSG
jgi:predicted sulfurtransferase